MRGHIVKRARNSYSIVFDSGKDPATGRRKQHWASIIGSKKDAEKKLAELLHQLDNGTYIKPDKITLAEFLERWLRDYVKPNLAPRSTEGYESVVRCQLIPSLGKMVLTQLKPEHIQRYYSEKLTNGRFNGKGGLNPKTVRNHHMVLHRALEIATKWGLITHNPADAIDPPRCQRKEINTLNEHDLNSFLESAKKTPYYALFYIALFTGMRRSEILALKWSDVDLMLEQISVNRTMHHLRDGSIIFRPPKTEKGRRLVSLSPSTTLVLKEYHQMQEAICLMLGRTLKDDDLVFAQIDGQPLLPGTVSHAWMNLAKRLDMGKIRLHDARHTHASLMLKQGVHPKIVQERLGHASIQLTLDTYSHVAPGLQEAAAQAFDYVLSISKKKEPIKKIR
ncbi:tyrosine-type recombinase/integrase [Chloroflexota bacterium]